MNTITITLAILAIITATFSLLLCFFKLQEIEKDISHMTEGLRDCATRTRTNKLHLDTLANKLDKPKAKRGRPKKNAPKPHQVNGVQ